ncbi:MAG: MaoC family dehydratase [Promethearchaeota archaeon]
MAEKVKFEDVELDYELSPLKRHITQESIIRFACGSLDFNPIHIDTVWAKKINLLGLGRTIAHGQMTIAFITQVITNWCYADGGRLKSIDIKLVKPLFPEDTIICYGKVVAKHPRKKERSFVDIEIYAENQKGEKVAVGKVQVYLLNC